MFEDALVESAGKLRSTPKRWMLATLAFNLAVLAALILIPLLRPQSLPQSRLAPVVSLPPRAQAGKPHPQHALQNARFKAPLNAMIAPARVPHLADPSPDPPTPDPATEGVMSGTSGSQDATGAGILTAMGSASPAPVIVTKPEARKPSLPVRVSSGVAMGALLNKATPVYPAIAKASRVSGSVLLHAVISRAGTIEALQVISGPEMLRASALDAVRQWRYRPYLLNGEPTEVETTVTVNFSMGS